MAHMDSPDPLWQFAFPLGVEELELDSVYNRPVLCAQPFFPISALEETGLCPLLKPFLIFNLLHAALTASV